MVTYENSRGEWLLYETKVLLRGNKEALVQSFFLTSRPPQPNKGWRISNKVRDGFEIYESGRIKMPFVRKKVD